MNAAKRTDLVMFKAKLTETLEDSRDSQVVVAVVFEILIATTPLVGAREPARFTVESAAVEVEHHLVGADKPLEGLTSRIASNSCNLVH